MQFVFVSARASLETYSDLLDSLEDIPDLSISYHLQAAFSNNLILIMPLW